MRRAALLAAALAGLGLASPAHAASFDCGKAQAPDEWAVCADPALSALDSEMGGLWFAYGRFPMLMGANGNRHDEARAFLTSRAACGANATCLTALYQARIAALKQQITAYIKTMPPL